MSRKFTRHENAPPKYQGLAYRVKAEHVNELQIALEEDDFRINQKADTSAVHGMVVDEVANSETVTDAAAAAVTTEIAGRDIIEGTDERMPARTVDPNFSYAVTDQDGNASWLAVHPDGSVPEHSAEAIGERLLHGAQFGSGTGVPVFAVADREGNASWLAVNGDGAIPSHSIRMLREALAGALGSRFVAPDAIYEWWINEAFTWLGDRMVATLYGIDGSIRAMEWMPGIGITADVVAAHTITVDDHNAPGHWAADGERAVLVWQRHNMDTLLRVQVSEPGPDMASFADAPVVEIDIGIGVTYGQPKRIEHLSDETQNTFWCPFRHYDNQWRIQSFSVDKASGGVTVGPLYPFARSLGGQFYASFAEANDPSGTQVLRVALAHNPARFTNSIWYLELDCETGDVTSPLHSGITHNIFTATDDLELRGPTSPSPIITPAVAHDELLDRRLFYVSAGPYHRRIAYAEWDASDPDSAVYKVVDLDSYEITNYGPAGTRFGYVGSANYLPGMCFDSPANDDTVYLARNPIVGRPTIERHWTSQQGPRATTLLEATATTPIRPMRPLGGGPFVMYFDLETYGVEGAFYSTGSTRSILQR